MATQSNSSDTAPAVATKPLTFTTDYGKPQRYKGMDVLITHGAGMDYHMVSVEVFDPISGETLRVKGSNILRNEDGFIRAINELVELLLQWRLDAVIDLAKRDLKASKNVANPQEAV